MTRGGRGWLWLEVLGRAVKQMGSPTICNHGKLVHQVMIAEAIENCAEAIEARAFSSSDDTTYGRKGKKCGATN